MQHDEQRAKLWVLAGIVHIGLVAFTLWGVRHVGAATSLSTGLSYYRTATGLFRDYRFFAPSVGNDVRAGFIVERKNESTVHMITASQREAALRLECIVGASLRFKKVQDLMTQSWAATALGLHDDAKSAIVFTESYFVPDMAGFRDGVKPEWKMVYAGRFDRSEKVQVQ